MSADDSDRADAIFQLERRWQSHLKKLRQQLLKDADKPLTQDRQIVEDVLELIGGAVTIEDGIKRPIGRGDVEGALYHMRQAIEATRRVQARQTKPTKRAMNRLIAALRKAVGPTGGLPEDVRLALGLERTLYHLEAYTKAQRKPKRDAIEKRLAADFALDLCERFGVKTTTARTGKYCRVAAALYGDPGADPQFHCTKALAENRDKNRPRF